jgi:hypothetical protein
MPLFLDAGENTSEVFPITAQAETDRILDIVS